jgi:hypothetical protein
VEPIFEKKVRPHEKKGYDFVLTEGEEGSKEMRAMPKMR